MFLASLSFRNLSIPKRKTLALQKQTELKLFWNTHRRISHTRKLRLRIDSVSKDSVAVKAGHQIRLQQQQPCLQFGVIWGLFNGAWSTFVCHLTVSSRSCGAQTQMWVGDRGGGGRWWGFGPACSPFCLLLLVSLVGLFVYRWALPTPAHHGLIGT